MTINISPPRRVPGHPVEGGRLRMILDWPLWLGWEKRAIEDHPQLASPLERAAPRRPFSDSKLPSLLFLLSHSQLAGVGRAGGEGGAEAAAAAAEAAAAAPCLDLPRRALILSSHRNSLTVVPKNKMCVASFAEMQKAKKKRERDRD